MTKYHLKHDEKEGGPEKLHLPDDTHCTNGHELVDEAGHPTESLSWDHKGEPKCAEEEGPQWDILQAVLEDIGYDKPTCPNGDPLTPNTVDYIANKDRHVDVKCKECGAVIPYKEKVQKAPKFDEEHHRAFQPGGDYEKHHPAMVAFYHKRAEKDFLPRARKFQTEVTPGKQNYDVHRMVDQGFQAGALKHGDTVSFDHFIPLAAGGHQSPENMVATEKEFNRLKGDSLPSTYEAKKFGMEHYLPLIHVLNPRNIGYLNEHDQVDEKRGSGYIRDDSGAIKGAVPWSDARGTGTLRGRNFKRDTDIPKRLYDPKSTQGAGVQAVGSGGRGDVQGLGMGRVISRKFSAPGVVAKPGTAFGGGGLNTLGVNQFDPHDLKYQDAPAVKYVESHHAADQKAGVRISEHEFPKGVRNKNVQAHLDELVRRTGPIRGFDHSSTGQALFHHKVDESGNPTRTFMNPAVKAHMLSYLHQEGAKMALPSAIAQTHAPILGHASNLKVAPEHEADYINRLEQHTGKVDFGTQPRSLFVDHPTDKTQDKVINPALRKHVREYTRSKGGLRSAGTVQHLLSDQKPVTLRKGKSHVVRRAQSNQLPKVRGIALRRV